MLSNTTKTSNGLPVASCEELSIAPVWLDNFLNRLDQSGISMHSAIVMRHGRICMETYYEPYDENSLHRMFSITKSFVAMAIGLLLDDGLIKLEDRIVDYFPEKQPVDGPFEYTAMLTIKEMLAMTTCHNKTTYKFENCSDWVGFFFTTKPTHVPGTNFCYDTSSTHVLGALVEKLTNMKLLDYLRMKALNRIGFSKDAYCLCDPSGISMGGSGMCAKSTDILKMIMLIAQDGEWRLDENGNETTPVQLLPKEYVIAAKKKQSDPYAKQGTFEEMIGYGYQIWMTRNNGYALYGMGGQLALHIPDKDIILVTTADTQGRQGGVQLIYDAFFEEVYDKIEADNKNINNVDTINRKNISDNYCFKNVRKLFCVPGALKSPLTKIINDKLYICDSNTSGIKNIRIHFNEDELSGFLEFVNNSGAKIINFKVSDNAYGVFPDYNLSYAASGAWRLDSYFLIKVQIIDSAVGNMFIALNFKDNYITVMFRKIEESLFNEYNCVFSGKYLS